MTGKPIAFFAHHQGRGHANRIMAIAEHLPETRELVVLTAAPEQFDEMPREARIIELPNMIGAPSRSAALHEQPTPSVMHCVPLGVAEMREHMGIIADTLRHTDPALFVVDVSAEIALLARIMSVPAVSIRMHGQRGDAGHRAAYEASVGMLAPFDEAMEQSDYPEWARRRTHYTGGLCTTRDPVLDKLKARQKLGLEEDLPITLVIAGGGGSGTPYAPLTVAARAEPDALWLVAGPVHREGHETEFGNLRELGWIDNLTDYLSAADKIVASAGDNTVHEIARAEKPFLCIPEWRYFDEQRAKAQQLERLGAAVVRETWPASIPEWQTVLAETNMLEPGALARLHDPEAARNAAQWLEEEAERLWQSS
ncbi:glycosyltransferase [Paraurantiacibacter namhicola]|uniref:Undecaprenyldiphospho-muramoylpentapeptide beta-N-acetylglucosaminyltransferase n=1 Tax=Paraurantiacibacter namhicola TaxID=645517 RepID=A0A1C7DB56_9SPHN|nr:glycosyltransferase [Paraurantiacibacter namhicola]ANU08685.1 undecaprenyldiphospho-muramoylpentapeptide beta-N- acetylglucosaminyltransferase [Paraurantiacibacter namhicola]